MSTTWRDWIKPQVAEIIERVGTSDMVALRKALIAGRPHMVRSTSHGLKIWRDEVNEQLGVKKAREHKAAIASDEARGQGFFDLT